MMQEILERS